MEGGCTQVDENFIKIECDDSMVDNIFKVKVASIIDQNMNSLEVGKYTHVPMHQEIWKLNQIQKTGDSTTHYSCCLCNR